jgi:hypothetical protein
MEMKWRNETPVDSKQNKKVFCGRGRRVSQYSPSRLASRDISQFYITSASSFSEDSSHSISSIAASAVN